MTFDDLRIELDCLFDGDEGAYYYALAVDLVYKKTGRYPKSRTIVPGYVFTYLRKDLGVYL